MIVQIAHPFRSGSEIDGAHSVQEQVPFRTYSNAKVVTVPSHVQVVATIPRLRNRQRRPRKHDPEIDRLARNATESSAQSWALLPMYQL